MSPLFVFSSGLSPVYDHARRMVIWIFPSYSRHPCGAALKGPARIAQGNALGNVSLNRYALKGQLEPREDTKPAMPQSRSQILLHIVIRIEIGIGIGIGNRRS